MGRFSFGDEDNTFTAPFNEPNSILGGGGNDTLTGGKFSDQIDGGSGDDNLYGGAGEDQLSDDSGRADFFGGAGDDRIQGGAGDDIAYGDDGSDVIDLGEGDNTAFGGGGDDELRGGPGTNRLSGGSGDDLFSTGGFSEGIVIIDGGAGVDTVSYEIVKAVSVNLRRNVGGGDAAGDSWIGVENVYGSQDGADTLIGDGASNSLYGLGANDRIAGGAGGDTLYGGLGRDTLDYATSDIRVVINLGKGVAFGGDAQGDTFFDFEYVIGSAYGDNIVGDVGVNILKGFGGNDVLSGGDDQGGDPIDDELGAPAAKTLNDTLYGGVGNDYLTGGFGTDKLYGEAGLDRFIYRSVSESGVEPGQYDVIMDFSRADRDRIDVAAIDANKALDGDQAFSFIGAAAFSGVAGELRSVVTAGKSFVYADVNGDRTADFSVLVLGSAPLLAGDFIL